MQITEIALAQIVPTPDNPRMFPAHDPALDELAESIKQHGVLEPVLCRPHPEKEGCVDLRAGERRYRAAKMAGLATLPCIVREMSDEEALVITVTENWQRQDLHPLEEANGIQRLLDKGWTFDQVSAQLGAPVPRIARRAQLSKLSPRWRKLVADDEHISEWPVSHLELVARLPVNAQDDYLDAENGFKYNGMPSLYELRNALANRTQALSAAPWKLDDKELLQSVGSCEACLRRSDRQPELFDDEDFGKPTKRGPHGYCLDAACWKSKAEAWQTVLLTNAKAKHENLVVAGYGDKMAKSWEFRPVKKTDPGAVPVFDTTEGGKGFFWGKPTTFSSASAKKSTGEKTLDEKRTDLERLRRRLVIGDIVEELQTFLEGMYCHAFFDTDLAGLYAFIRAFGTDYQSANTMYSDVRPWESFKAARADEAKTLRELFLSAVAVCASRLRSGNLNDNLPAGEEERVCEFFGQNIEEFWERARAKKKEPKSWAQEEAAATKEADKPAAKKKGKASKKAKKAEPSAEPIHFAEDDDTYDEMEVEDERIGTLFDGDSRVNKYGVFTEYDTINLSKRLPGKAYAKLRFVSGRNGDWRQSCECGLSGAGVDSFRLGANPSICSESYPTRRAAILASWLEVREAFARRNGSLKDCKAAMKALDEWHHNYFETPTQGMCSVCGCVENRACVDEYGTPCSWANSERTLCSACVDVRELAV